MTCAEKFPALAFPGHYPAATRKFEVRQNHRSISRFVARSRAGIDDRPPLGFRRASSWPGDRSPSPPPERVPTKEGTEPRPPSPLAPAQAAPTKKRMQTAGIQSLLRTNCHCRFFARWWASCRRLPFEHQPMRDDSPITRRERWHRAPCPRNLPEKLSQRPSASRRSRGSRQNLVPGGGGWNRRPRREFRTGHNIRPAMIPLHNIGAGVKSQPARRRATVAGGTRLRRRLSKIFHRLKGGKRVWFDLPAGPAARAASANR